MLFWLLLSLLLVATCVSTGGSSAASSNTGIGSTLLNLLFGGNNSSILGALTSFAGFKNSGSAGKLLSLASPFILGWLKKKVTSEGFGLSGLTTWLSGNKNDIMSAIPGSMNSALGFSNLGSTSGSTHKAASTASYDNNNGGGGSNWWMWLLGLLAALGLLWFLMKGCNKTNMGEKVSNTMEIGRAHV